MSRRVLLLGLMLACLGSSTAAPPAWWATRGATDTNPPNDDAAVNQGQLKQFTQKAVQELNARIPGGAGADLNSLVNGWVQAYQSGGYNATNPLPADFEAMNSGQLKWIANKVHARLVFAKYEDALPAWLVQNQAADHQLVNLGQLKTVFNFDLTAPPGQLPDWWQKFYFDGQTGIDPTEDYDGDGLNNAEEYANGLMPDSWDTDGDDLPDGWEIANQLNALDDGSINEVNGDYGDPDGDGVFNLVEYWYGTNPRNPDTDLDGLSDDEEIYATATDPTEADSDHDGTMDPAEDPDHDGLTNLAELRTHLTFPDDSDTDNDTLLDGWEIANGLDPRVHNSITDPDEDGLTNAQEQYLGTAPLIDDTDHDQILDGAEDPDGDGLSNLVELNTHHTDPFKADTDDDSLTDSAEINIHLTDPLKHDTDGDRLPDGWEILYALNALNANGANGADGDTDPDGELNPGDRLSHFLEFINKTDPTKQDTDGDGTSDFDEIAQGSDPNDPTDGGQPPTDRVIEVPFKIYGDYASWEMKVQGLGPRDRRELFVITPAIDVPKTEGLKLWRNNNYKVTLRFTGSKDTPEKPWYCWEARVSNQPGQQTFNDYQPDRIPGVAEFFTIGDGHWLVDNRHGLFTAHNHRTASRGGNATARLESFLVPVDIDDNSFATGVDDVSVTSTEPELRGYQNQFWIMAPCGGQEYNGMRFKIPLDPAANLKIETSAATPNPVNSTLGTANPSPVVTWQGTDSSIHDHTPVWKIGEAQAPADLAIRVKNMKYRTVTVAVFPVRDPQSNRAVVPLPAESVLQAKMDETFGVQLNAWISLDYRPQQNYDYDPDGDGYAILLENPTLSQMSSQSSFNAPNADIRVFVVDNVYLRNRQENVPGTLVDEVYGYAPAPSAITVNAGNPTEGIRSDQKIIDTIAHEIGHILVGPGHPGDYNLELRFGGNQAGPAPLPGTDTTVRLMSGETRVPGARLLVKTEWDLAEEWLSSRPGGDN